MAQPLCLFALLYSQREHHEDLLRDFVMPVVAELRAAPELDSLFFARFNVPRWTLRFRILGEPRWIEGPVRDLVESRLAALDGSGLLEGVEFATYDREIERYGGPLGMALAERIFLFDTLACLDFLDLERRGLLDKARRELSLVMTERFLDLLGFSAEQRLAFYRYGYRWAIDMETWDAGNLAVLEGRYQELRDGLVDVFRGEESRDPVLLWGGEEAARVADRCLASTRPVVDSLLEAHSVGRIAQDLGYLAWSYTHMHCNRLGLDPTPEAVLRFFMHRFYEDEIAGATA